MADQALAALQDRIRAAAAAMQPLVICGGGTKTFYGEACVGERVETTTVAGIVAYAPNELVITARGGTLLAEIELAMAEQRRRASPPAERWVARSQQVSRARGARMPVLRGTSCSACALLMGPAKPSRSVAA